MSKSKSERVREKKLRRAAANSAKTEQNIRSVLDIDSHHLKMTVPGGFLEDWLAYNPFLEPVVLIYPLTLIALCFVLPFVIWPIINGESLKRLLTMPLERQPSSDSSRFSRFSQSYRSSRNTFRDGRKLILDW